MQATDVGFHVARILLVVLAVTGTAWPMQALARAGSIFDRAGVARGWLALTVVSFAAVLLMLLACRRPQAPWLRGIEAVLALLLSVVPSGLLGYPPGPRWVAIGLLGRSVQPLATAWLVIVLTRPAASRRIADIPGRPADTIAER